MKKLYACMLLATLAMAVVITSGCVDGAGKGSDSANASLATSEYESQHYQVRVVGMGGQKGQEAARQGAYLMERMFDVYAALDEIPLPPGDVMPFWVHFNRKEYDRQAALYDFPANTTNGFCSTAGEVHVYFRKSGRIPPEATAMHEGFHQYAHRALHYPTPTEVFARVQGYKNPKLPTVPLWLNEGMAMNIESGEIQRDHNGMAVSVSNVGSVNRERLSHLVSLIKANQCPSVRAVMNLIMGDQVTINDYSVMWGVVFDLRMATGNAIFAREQVEMERMGPEAVRQAIDAAIDPYRPYPYMRWPVPVSGRLMRACRVAWGLDVPSLVETCAKGAREPRDFDRQWNRRLTQAALMEVEKLLHDQGESLEQWEQGWKKRMLSLHAQVQGGQYIYTEPDGINTARSGRAPSARHSITDWK